MVRIKSIIRALLNLNQNFLLTQDDFKSHLNHIQH